LYDKPIEHFRERGAVPRAGLAVLPGRDDSASVLLYGRAGRAML
jgi:hypothetical protein